MQMLPPSAATVEFGEIELRRRRKKRSTIARDPTPDRFPRSHPPNAVAQKCHIVICIILPRLSQGFCFIMYSFDEKHILASAAFSWKCDRPSRIKSELDCVTRSHHQCGCGCFYIFLVNIYSFLRGFLRLYNAFFQIIFGIIESTKLNVFFLCDLYSFTCFYY